MNKYENLFYGLTCFVYWLCSAYEISDDCDRGFGDGCGGL